MKLVRSLSVCAFIFVSSLATSGQTLTVPPRVTQPVNAERLVTLHGNTHPLARPEFDQGAAPDSLPMERMLLVVQRSAEQESALRKLLDEQQVKSSPSYHMWLTPEQFGQQFGPPEADIQAVTNWLASQGFAVIRMAAGRTIIEFSGTAGTVRQALHTEIHKFAVNGEEHWANASDPQIPAALRPVVAGFASLNNFPRQSMLRRLGIASRTKTGVVKPLYTVPTSSANFYALGPTDFATIYNVLPLWQASSAIDGTGQTIAIVAQTNINVQDVLDFRTLFGLPDNAPQIIVNGPDPGITMTGDETESDLDSEWSGAVAKNATIDLVVSESTEASAGVDLSALYVIDNNLAPVMSESYGACEAYLGVGGNAFLNTLHEQGSAQGITIVVSAGDAGSALCDQDSPVGAAQDGLTVSGTASTPFNVAVGGTDFNDVNTWSTYWSNGNNPATLDSAMSYIPEATWNESCASSGVASGCASAGDTPAGTDLVAGSGGASNCVMSSSTSTSITCSGGYPKPPWQTGTGVPNDSARDIPDVSLFAGDGTNGTAYTVCEVDALPAGYPSCNRAYPDWFFLPVGGTSGAAPTFAAFMALVNQATGQRQGNANYVLYPLAAMSGSSCASNAGMALNANSSSCIFYDVVTGNNSVACVGGSPNCSSTTSGGYGLLEVNPPTNTSPAWTTNAGYDLASGLGSVNAANLVKNWTAASFTPTTTILASLTPTTLTHGQPATFTVNVAPGSGSGTPTGDVSLLAQTGASPSHSTGIGPFSLSGGSVSSSTVMLPGGTYGLTAHYAGNGTYGASDSTPPVQVTVNPEGSQTHVALLTIDLITGQIASTNATSTVYGSSLYVLRVDVTNSSGLDCFSFPYACPTGEVTISDNGQPLDLGSYALNTQGYTEDQFTQLAGGANKVVATYSGDASFNTSTAADAIIITPAPTTTALTGLPSSAVGELRFECTVTINSQSYGVAPTGTVQFFANGAPFGNATPVAGLAYMPSGGSFAMGQVSQLITLSPGMSSITVQYSGDARYGASVSAATTINIADFSVTANPATITIPAAGQSGTSTITLTPQGGFTGAVALSCNSFVTGGTCTFSPSLVNLSGASPATATITVTSTAQVSSTTAAPRLKAPPGGIGIFPPLVGHRLPVQGWWLLASLLTLAALTSLGAVRRQKMAFLLACSLLVIGIWAACGGGNPASTPAPSLSLSPSSLTFSKQNMGRSGAAQTVTVGNTGSGSLAISSISIGGTNVSDFAQTNTCGAALAAGANCAISVIFTPTATGSRTASLAIFDNATGSPQTVNLTGTGIPPATQLGNYVIGYSAQSGNDMHAGQLNVVVQ